MAFRFWQVGLHIQPHEAWRLPSFAARQVGIYSAGGVCRWRNTQSATDISTTPNSLWRCYNRGVASCRNATIYTSLFLRVGRGKSAFPALQCRFASVNKRPG